MTWRPLALLALSSPAWACSFAGPEAFLVDPSVEDAAGAPLAPIVEVVSVTRGTGPRPGGFATSCDDLGIVTLTLAQPDEDPHADGEVGYLVHEAGRAVDEADPPIVGGELLWIWIDGADRVQEPLDLALTVTPVSRDGTLGESVDVRVEDPGRGGCSHTGGPLGLAWGLVALGLGRRRRG